MSRMISACWYLLAVLMGLGCGSPDRQGLALSNLPVKVATVEQETMEQYIIRFNEWYKVANRPVVEGYDKALSELVLEDGGEWDCYWEMDYKTINAAVREALNSNDVLQPQLSKAWLSIVEGYDAAQEVCTVGRLLFSEKFTVPRYGDKMDSYFPVAKSIQMVDGFVNAQWEPGFICGGSTVQGLVHVKLALVQGQLQLAESEYREDE